MKRMITLVLIAGLALVPIIGQGSGYGGGKEQKGKQSFNGGINQLLLNLPEEALDQLEEMALIRNREEEKLARDLYMGMFEIWNHNVFQNLARSEQRHIDALSTLIEKYGLTDPGANNPKGIFSDPELQALYFRLMAQAQVSFQAALKAGAEIEDHDIFALKSTFRRTNNRDIHIAFQNLEKGSRNHLRIISAFLQRLQIQYQAQHLTQEEIQAILDSPHEQGLLNEKGEPFYGNTGW